RALDLRAVGARVWRPPRARSVLSGARPSTPSYRGRAVGLVERGAHLAALADQLDRAGEAGRLVLIGGEAGAGKTALVGRFLAAHAGGATVLAGQCDDLFAPRPLGPLADIARGLGGRLAAALEAGDPAAAMEAFLVELASPGSPVVVVLEDLQWADDATFDLVRVVARRLESLRCLVLVTYRTELAPDHPLRRAVGSLVGPLVTRVQVEPLSVDAVRALAGGADVDAVALHARTGGNAFFVTELLAEGADTVPVTVRDALVARATSLTGSARDALDAAAVLGRDCAVHVLQDVAGCELDAIDECVRAGLLDGDAARVRSRHDITRETVDAAMTPLRRRQLHARALEVLGDDGDLVELANHAIAASDSARVVALAAKDDERCVALARASGWSNCGRRSSPGRSSSRSWLAARTSAFSPVGSRGSAACTAWPAAATTRGSCCGTPSPGWSRWATRSSWRERSRCSASTRWCRARAPPLWPRRGGRSRWPSGSMRRTSRCTRSTVVAPRWRASATTKVSRCCARRSSAPSKRTCTTR